MRKEGNSGMELEKEPKKREYSKYCKYSEYIKITKSTNGHLYLI